MRVAILLLLLTIPTVALAAPSGFFGPIVPQCAYASANEPCQACDLVAAGDNLLRVLVALSVFAATLMLAYAGFLYVTAAGNSANIESAKSVFGRVLIGLILILGAFLIVDLVLRTLTDQNFNSLTRIQCAIIVHGEGSRPIQGSVFVPAPSREERDAAPPSRPATAGGMTHDAAMKKLEDACRNEGACVDVTSTTGPGGVSGTCSGAGCTNLSGISESTIDQAIALAKACGCRVSIIGGTETGAGHAGGAFSHLSGHKIDIVPTDKMDDYIKTRYTYVGNSYDPQKNPHGGPQYRDKCGNIYTWEQNYNHWDVRITRSCAG